MGIKDFIKAVLEVHSLTARVDELEKNMAARIASDFTKILQEME